MTARTFAILDANATGPGLVLDQGNLIAYTEGNALDFHRCVHATIAKAVGNWYFECYFSSVLRTSLAGQIAVGLAQPDSALDLYVGEDALAFGLLPADGEVRSNDIAVSSSIPIVAERVCIGVYYRLSDSPQTVAWYADGNQIARAELPSGKFWVPAFTVSGGDDGTVKVECNFGLDAFDAMPMPTIS